MERSSLPPSDSDEDDRGSSFRLEFTLAVGYKRRRSVLGGEFEGHVVTIGLLVGGIVLIFWVIEVILRLFNVHILGG